MNKIEELIKKLEEEKSDLTIKANYKRSLKREAEQSAQKDDAKSTSCGRKMFGFFIGSFLGIVAISALVTVSPFTLFATLPIEAGLIYQGGKNMYKLNISADNHTRCVNAIAKYNEEIKELEQQKETLQEKINLLTKYKNGLVSTEDVISKFAKDELSELEFTDVKVENDTIISTKQTIKKPSTKQEKLIVANDQIEVVKE